MAMFTPPEATRTNNKIQIKDLVDYVNVVHLRSVRSFSLAAIRELRSPPAPGMQTVLVARPGLERAAKQSPVAR